MSTPSESSRMIDVVGGVYRERCMRPSWREVYGSAGRAASALKAMGASVTLHSYMASLEKEVIESRAALEDFQVIPTPVDQSVTFEYHHCLETPRIFGLGKPQPPLELSADWIVRFGLLERDAVIKGGQVVYDPQNARSPEQFDANGSNAEQLALILNRNEAELLTGLLSRKSGRQWYDNRSGCVGSGEKMLIFLIYFFKFDTLEELEIHSGMQMPLESISPLAICSQQVW